MGKEMFQRLNRFAHKKQYNNPRIKFMQDTFCDKNVLDIQLIIAKYLSRIIEFDKGIQVEFYQRKNKRY